MLNLLGGLIPAATAIVCTPLILRVHGSEFFGTWALQTAMLVVVGLMDLGISRGITLVTFDKAMNPSGDPIGPFKAGMRLSVALAAVMLTIGVIGVGGYFIWRGSNPDLIVSTLIYLVSGALTILTLPYRSLMEIQGRFGILNTIRSAAACAVYIAPLLVVPQSRFVLASTAGVILISRAVALLAYSGSSGVSRERLRAEPAPHRDWVRRFAQRCGWVGLTNALSLALTYADRFILGAVSSTTQVAHYVVASEAATKIWLITGAVQSAVTPRVAAEISEVHVSQTDIPGPAVRRAKGLVLGVVVIPSAVLILFCEPVFRFWLGTGFDVEIVRAARVLIAGFALNSMSQFNFSLLQLHGGEASGALLQVVNVALSAIFMAVLIPMLGALGAAAAFSLRLAIDAFVTRHLVFMRSRSVVGFSHLELGATCVALIVLLWGTWV
jgi:O-antigen/teichoic acid export membrane protein